MSDSAHELSELVRQQEAAILEQWLQHQAAATHRGDDERARQASRQFLALLPDAIRSGGVDDIDGRAWDETRALLADISTTRARQGSTPSETATFVFSLKQALFAVLRGAYAGQAERLADSTWHISSLLDKLGLYTMEVFQKSRDQIIARQQQELLELSTPVVKLWKDVLALPLIGTLDSSRTQVVMESLLEKIVETGAAIAIIDITGVPTVDTLVAQHLMKTIAAARLMGADCIISGIRPQIAQTIVHLGVNLEDVVTKATLADAFTLALGRLGASIVQS
ncbi:STAS domain-containing protein [Oxalobacteraceae bacterium A2-2]